MKLSEVKQSQEKVNPIMKQTKQTTITSKHVVVFFFYCFEFLLLLFIHLFIDLLVFCLLIYYFFRYYLFCIICFFFFLSKTEINIFAGSDTSSGGAESVQPQHHRQPIGK
jgi:hypothetical protein